MKRARLTHGGVRSDVFKEVLSGLERRVRLLLLVAHFWKHQQRH